MSPHLPSPPGWQAAARRGSTLALAVVALAILAALSGGAMYYYFGRSSKKEEKPITATAEIKPFEHVVVEQGEVESSENVEVKCEVKGFNGSTAILWVIPEGTQVKKGDLLVRLDSSALEQERLQQEVVCNTAKALVVQSQNAYEAAEIAKREYLEGTFKQEEQLIQSEIFQAQENLRRAQIAARSGASLADKGIVKPQQMEADQFAVEKARLELEAAQTKLKVLQEYTKAKMLKTLESDIATAKAKWESDQKSYEIEMTKLQDTIDQIAKCEIRSPADGQVVYANVVSSRGGNAEFIVEPGAMVREQQTIIRLPNPAKMQVKAKINESQITAVRPGMPAKIRIDAFSSDQALSGVVAKVNEYPEPSSWFSSPIKQYLTFVKITDPPQNIRPGLTAEVAIQVERRPQALQVPVQAIYDHFGTIFCIVWDSGTWDLREVTIGPANDKFVVIESGLDPGETVVMNPRRWLAKVQLPEPPEEILTSEAPAEDEAGSGAESADPSAEAPPEGPLAGGAGGGPSLGGPSLGGPGLGGSGAPGGPSGGRGPGGDLFARFDANGDGVLSSDEIPAERGAWIKAADADGDGSVTRAELAAARAKRMAAGGGPGGPGGGPAGFGGPGGPPRAGE